MDDTFVALRTTEKEHINSIDPHIQSAVEDTRADGSIPFLATLVMPEPNNFLSTAVYRKPTHTDLNLQWDSDHNLAAKFNVINT